ncbi:MAG: DnaB-like helicase C-terminal domain-containing protein [Kofleriaceae bacterium]
MEHAKVAVKRLFSSLDQRFRQELGAPTGIPVLDASGGLRAGELAVLAGHPGVGKTALAISMATHTAAQSGAVLWFSLAETTVQTTERMLLHQAAMRPGPLRIGALQRQDMTDLTYAAATVSKWALHIEDAIDLDAAQIRERAREWRSLATSQKTLIIVDYLQLIAEECDPDATLRSLLGTAKATSSALLLVSQHLADARQRASLESIATAVIYLRAEPHTHEILLAKHRYCKAPQTEEVLFDGTTFAKPPKQDDACASSDRALG